MSEWVDCLVGGRRMEELRERKWADAALFVLAGRYAAVSCFESSLGRHDSLDACLHDVANSKWTSMTTNTTPALAEHV